MLHIHIISSLDEDRKYYGSGYLKWVKSRKCARKFVLAQGSNANLSPIPDEVGFYNTANLENKRRSLSTQVDYLGIQDRWIKDETGGDKSFNTQVSVQCFVKKVRDSPNVMRVEIQIRTQNANTFVQDIDDVQEERTIIGNNPQYIMYNEDAQILLTNARFKVEFSMSMDDFNGDIYPDLTQLIADPKEEQLPYQYGFEADNDQGFDLLQECQRETIGDGQICGSQSIDIPEMR